jgi:hypothetical protein
MAGDVHRAGGQWHTADGAPAVGFAPPGPPHLPRTARTGVHWRCAVTGGHTGASTCAPEAGTARTAVADVATRDVALWTRSGARGQIVFPDSIFKFDFLQFSKLNCTLVSEAKL